MVVSLNEVEALCAKAARGAGCGWGVADDIARAARWMAERQLDWSAPLSRLLGAPRLADHLRPVFHVADLLPGASPGDTWRLEGCEPVWTMAILSVALHAGTLTLDLAWDGGDARLKPGGGVGAQTPWPAFEALGPRSVDITARAGAPALDHVIAATARRRPVPRAAWDALETVAARTYVAASPQSRNAGAGGARVDAE